MSVFDNTNCWGETEERRQLLEDFWAGLLAIARERGTRHALRWTHGDPWLASTSDLPGISWNYLLTPDRATVELYIDHAGSEGNELMIDALFSRRDKCEMMFGAPLIWECVEGRPASRVRYEIDLGGFRAPEDQWPELQNEMVSRMIALEAALGPELLGL